MQQKINLEYVIEKITSITNLLTQLDQSVSESKESLLDVIRHELMTITGEPDNITLSQAEVNPENKKEFSKGLLVAKIKLMAVCELLNLVVYNPTTGVTIIGQKNQIDF